MAVLAMFDIQKNLKQLPDSPGVYIHKDGMGNIIYVGKAVSLRNRVRQYFQSSKNMDIKVRAMVGQISEFEYISCATEMEAFILESNLIKKHRPKYNILLRDDKSYPYIKITVGEKYPRLMKTRMTGKEGEKYFGPYSDVGAVNMMIDLLNRVYRLKQCSAANFPEGARPCLNYHINRCDGVCTGKVEREEYLERIGSIEGFLKGKNTSLEEYLKERMEEAAEALDYEKAASYRDYLQASRSLADRQRVVLKDRRDMDLIICDGGKGKVDTALFFVRGGKLTGREGYVLESETTVGPGEAAGEFIRQYYEDGGEIPGDILVGSEVPDREMLEKYLSDIEGRKVRIYVPQRGEKRALMEMAQKDVEQAREMIRYRAESRKEREKEIGEEIEKLLSDMRGIGNETRYPGDKIPAHRIEAYDISNTNGVDTVGGMVVFQGGKPDKKSYRRFKIRTVGNSDDYGAMVEMLYRRLKRAEDGDEGFSLMPDLILIDGGKGHVASVKKVLDVMKKDIAVAGMAKGDGHRTRTLVYPKGDSYEEIDLKERPLLFKYMGTIQEEVHRFAIEYHRGLRKGRTMTSALDEIPGIGKVKRNALLAHFKSIEAIKSADREQLKEVRGITDKNADAIIDFFDHK